MTIETHTVTVVDGPGSEHIMLSLHCLLKNESPPYTSFVLERGGRIIALRLVVTGVSILEGIEGTAIALTAGHLNDVVRFCPLRQVERKAKEFIFPNYNHHHRKGCVQIPSHYLDQIMESFK